MQTKRMITRLRFEAGQAVPSVGQSWLARTELGQRLTQVTLLDVRGAPIRHEDGAILLDAKVKVVYLDAEVAEKGEA